MTVSAAPVKALVTIDEIPSLVGKHVGTSQWRAVTQEMIDGFARSTDDHQWIHTDPERAARETPYGGTIAHGFLSLSMLSTLAYEALPELDGDVRMGVNYGFDEVRFQAPVKSGARVRAVFTLADADVRPSGRILFTYDVTLEIEDSTKPALTAQWLTLMIVRPRR